MGGFGSGGPTGHMTYVLYCLYSTWVGRGGGGGVWQVGQAQGRKWWFNKLSTCTKTKKTRPRGVFLVLVPNFSGRGLFQKPSN